MWSNNSSVGGMKMNPSKLASELGKRAKGKPKNLTPEEIKRRTKRLAEARKKRWPKPGDEHK